jgi:RHS repeat-associated protein
MLTAMDSGSISCRSGPRFVGDPIDVVTGANTDITVDFRLRGPLPVRWCRYYNSARNTVPCSLGWGHTHDFDRTLSYDLDGLHYTDPFGSEIPFPPLEIGEDAASAGWLLRRISQSTYELLQAGEPTQEFEFDESSSATHLLRLRQRGAEVSFGYAADGRLRRIVDSLGRSIAVDTHRDGRVLGLFLADPSAPDGRRALMVYEYDSAGNVIVGRDLYGATLRFRWDEPNRMTARTDRRGYSFYFSYDEQGRCVHSRGEDGLLEVFLDYQPDFKTTFVRRGDGGQWIYSFDVTGVVTQITDPYGGVTRFTVADTGRVTEEVDPNGNVTRFLYDGTGRHYARLDPLGYILPTYEQATIPRDPLAYELPETPLEWEHGRLLAPREILRPAPEDPVFNGFSPAVRDAFLQINRQPGAAAIPPAPAFSDDLLRRTEDEQGRLVEQGPPSKPQLWRYDPNGNLTEYHDSDGAVYRYVYRSWNALHQQIDPLGNATIFNQSINGLVNRVEDPGGTVTEYAYDLKDRLSEVRRDGRVRERYVYDAATNIIEKTDASGRRLVAWEVGPATLDRIRLLPDGQSHVFEYDSRGRIVAATTPGGTATFVFAEHGERLEDKRDGIGVVHEFDRRRLVATTCFDKFRTSYSTNDDGELFITDPTGARHRISVSDGGLILKQLANGARELCSYDSDGRCHRKVVMRNGEYGAWMRGFTYSGAGDLVAVSDTRHGTVGYEYDPAHRIAQETRPDGSKHRFTFDAAGNLLKQPGLADVRMGPGNRIDSANGDRFTYNDRGHVSAREGRTGTTHYEYDALDMLVRCEINGEEWTASYDGLCRRTRKTWRGKTTTYYWDDFRLAADVAHDGPVRVYVYEDQTALVPFMFVEYASLHSDPTSGRRYFIFTNQIGAPVRVEDDEGRLTWGARLDPYGRVEVSTGSSLEMSLRFPGHVHDPETGLHYNRFRYYSPELGRYLQSDPAGLEGGVNVYSYPTDPLADADIDALGRRGGGGSKPSARGSGKKGEGTPRGAGAGCPHAAGDGGKPPLRKDPPVEVGDVGTYKDLVARGRVGDGLTPDHIPSAASLIAAEEARRKKAGLKPLTPDQKKEIRDNGNCVVVPHDLHVAGNTYGGKNNEERIGQDAADPAGAQKRDMAAHKKNAEDHDVDPATMRKAERDLKKANEADGVTD